MKNVFRAISVAVILTLALTACGGGTTVQPTPTVTIPVIVNTPDPGNFVLPTAPDTTLCTNPYYPAKVGATWVYSSTGSPSGPYEYGERIIEVRQDGFTVQASFKGTPGMQQWQCNPDGLVHTTMIANNVASILAFRRFTDTVLTNITGVALPATITPGMTWTYDADFTANQVEFGTATPISGHLKLTYTAGNNESVTVLAGTFDTIAISISSEITYTMQTAAGPEVTNLKSTYTYWYAVNVGWVKASGAGRLGGSEYFETIELVKYTVP